MSRYYLRVFVLLALALLFDARRSAHAETYSTCTGFITSVPTVITTQGTWCLKQDLSTAISSGFAITINTNNVTIDCNDFKLGGLAAGLGTAAYGIYTQDHLNATIRHCNIRGFEYGAYFAGALGGGHTVEDNRFDGNTYTGILIEGEGSVVRRNRVFDTGNSTINVDAIGIKSDNDVDVLDNTVTSVVARTGGGGGAYGILTVFNTTISVSGNRVRGLVKDGAGPADAIFNGSSDRITVVGNEVVGDASAGSIGIRCSNTNGRAKDNVINGFVAGLQFCGDAGGNDINP